jgi:hypothetical protein
MNDDALSLSMFWAGALMVFTPIILAVLVIGIWWYQRKRATRGDDERRDESPPDD